MSDYWHTPDIAGMLNATEATLAANAGSFEKPLGPILMHFPPDSSYSRSFTPVQNYLGHAIDDYPGSMDQWFYHSPPSK